MDLCLAVKWSLGSRVAMQCWEQDSLDLEGIRKLYGEAEKMEGGGGDGQKRDRYDGFGRMF